MNRLSNRCLAVAFMLCLCSVLYSYYMEFVQRLNPCVLCLVERYAFFALTLLLLLRLTLFIIVPSKLLQLILSMTVGAVSALGIFVCFHHYKLQSGFDHKGFMSCGMPIGLYYQQNSLSQFIKHILYENIECARSAAYVFGVNILFWEIVLFFTVLILTMLTFLKDHK